MQSFSIADARAHFPKIINEAEAGKASQLTRRGKPVAVLLSLAEYESLISQRKEGLAEALKAYRALKEPDDDRLLDAEIDNWRDRAEGRASLWS